MLSALEASGRDHNPVSFELLANTQRGDAALPLADKSKGTKGLQRVLRTNQWQSGFGS